MTQRTIILASPFFLIAVAIGAWRHGDIVGSAGAEAAMRTPKALGAISISTEPAPALVFIDGVFIGQSSKDAPIVVTREAGRVQLRATEAGFLDALADVEIEAGITKSLAVALAEQKDKWAAPTTPILLGVGQVVRGALPRPGSEVRFLIAEEYVPERMLTIVAGTLRFEVTGPDGKKIEITSVPADESQGRPPGREYVQYKGTAPGSYTLVVTGSPGPFAFRFVQALRKPQVSADPNEPGRRAAPQPPKKN